MSMLKRQVSSSPNFALFFIVITHNSSVSFKLIDFLLQALRTLFHIDGAKFFRKGQPQGHLKQHNLEQNPA